MSIDQATIRNELKSWVATATGLTTIVAYQNAPTPTKPYLTIHLNNFSQIGIDYQKNIDGSGNTSFYGNREFMLEVNYFGDDGFEVLEKLKTSARQEDVLQSFTDAGVVFVDTMMQEDLTELIDSQYERRQMIEFRFRHSNQGITSPDEFNVGFITDVELEGDITEEDGDVRDVDFTVTS